MTPLPLKAFRLLVTEPDDGMPNGTLKLHYLAVAEDASQAIAAVRARRGNPSCGVEVLSEGHEDRTLADRLKLRPGDVTAL